MKKLSFEVTGFTQGLNNKDAPIILKPSEALDVQNVIFEERGAAITRPGVARHFPFKVAPSGAAFDDFSGRYSQFSTGWTNQWGSAGFWVVEKRIGSTGGSVLRYDGLFTNQHGFVSFNAIGETLDIEIETKFLIRALIDGDLQDAQLIARASGEESNKNGYVLSVKRQIDHITFELGKWINDQYINMNLSGTIEKTEQPLDVYVKLKLSGDNIGLKVWTDREPYDWLNTTDSSFESGLVGLGAGFCHSSPAFDYIKTTSTESTEHVTSLFEFSSRSGNTYLLAAAGRKICRAVAGGWASIYDQFSDGKLFSFAVNSVANKTLLVNGADGYFETDGLSCNEVSPYEPTNAEITEFGENSIPLKPKFIAYTHYRTFLANVEGGSDRVYYCGQDERGNILHNYFPIDNWVKVSSSRGEPITGIVAYKASVYVFTKTSIWIIMGEVPSEFVVYNVSHHVGAVSQRTIREIYGYLFFLGVDGVYVFNGQSAPTKISIKIPKTIRKINSLYRELACAVAHKGSFVLSVPETIVPDLHLYYDTDVVVKDYVGKEYGYVHNPWSVFKGFAVNDWLSSSDENLYFAGNDGYVYVYGSGDTDDGIDIESYLVTKTFNMDSSLRKWFKEIWIYTEPGMSGTMVVQYRIGDGDWENLRDVELDSQSNGIYFRNINRFGYTVAFRFLNKFSGQFKLYGFTMIFGYQGAQVGKAKNA